MRYWILPFVILAACDGGTDTDTDVDTDTDSELTAFETFINVTDPVIGDLVCYTAGTDWATMKWDTVSVDPDAVQNQSRTLLVEDFESEEAVADSTVEIWLNDVASGTPDDVVTTGTDGLATFASLPTCQPLAYRVSTDPLWDQTKITLAAHKIVSPDTTIDDTFTSVSKLTYQLIPTILGITPLPENAIIAGTAYDCNKEPIEGVQVVVYDENNEIPSSLQVEYFQEKFPSRDQPYTSADGVWVAINVPPGAMRVEMWGNVNDELVLIGATTLESYADTINLSNIYSGIGNGEHYPAECLLSE
jgi:hypothetical protein